MLPAFTYNSATSTVVPIEILPKAELEHWLTLQDTYTKNWLAQLKFGQAGHEPPLLIPSATAQLQKVLVLTSQAADPWVAGNLALHLPPGIYQFLLEPSDDYWQQAVLAWGLGAYQFTKYKKSQRQPAQLLLPENAQSQQVLEIIRSTYWVRDLINLSAADLNPETLHEATRQLAQEFDANFTAIVGDDLLKQNYPMIHAVGRASAYPPRLLDFQWGNPQHPKLTLVGKGVCFDTGGLDLKNDKGMLLMKKDMGGAAHVLGLARLIMAHNLPVRLRVLIAAVENSVAGNAYRPGDVITTRKGLTVEIGNTDAEGRLVLADALCEAAHEKPELLLDFATLTGAARVAVGTEIAGLFTADDQLAQALSEHASKQHDPVWRLPLYTPYRKLLNSYCADINNVGHSSYAGATIAALFLKEFVPAEISWAHFDMMAWNVSSLPGRPEGGEAMGMRAVFSYLQQRYTN